MAGNEENISKMYLNTAEMLELRKTDYPAFIDKLYESMTSNPDMSIGDTSRDDTYKAEALQVLITYYEETEHFERCQKLYEIQKEILSDGE
jgi:hypothetical protein